jgi:DNA adenine methylase
VDAAAMPASPRVVPRPFIKWAGGKTQLLGPLTERIARLDAFGRYHEPFLGGGALFFALHRSGQLGRGAALSDVNPNLVEAWTAVRDDVEGLVTGLSAHRADHGRTHYYAVRAVVPETPTARAARVVYLNRTCFNGLYRENARGAFNVPMGRYTNPAILDEANLRACATALRDTDLSVSPFSSVLTRAAPGDLVYFDPPYVPVSPTASFTRYARDDFREPEQRRLAEVFETLTERGVYCMLSNSWTPLVRSLYARWNLTAVPATRHVNRRTDRRGPVDEALVDNFSFIRGPSRSSGTRSG